MERLTMSIGGALAAVGAVAYIGSGAESVTALIPTALGAVMIGCAVAARRPARRKAAMHVAAAIGVLGVMGSTRFISDLPEFFDGTGDISGWAVGAQAVSLVLFGAHTVASIRSFRRARLGGAAA